ncbi:unnamed protein product [Gongylonema pulchrum]|uniref:SHR-BD domain-containing protein n=1 Tax=Gongylonema pulchrum TaxID=637853 RepID=A0A183D3J8_9BILA|nr:unnamed protein product [Gongylonema pulchrum]
MIVVFNILQYLLISRPVEVPYFFPLLLRRIAVVAVRLLAHTLGDSSRPLDFCHNQEGYLSMYKSGDVDHLHLRMKDSRKRDLDMYCSVSIASTDAVSLALWASLKFLIVPYWIVNKSGIPLIVKQEATEGLAAGQMEEHERAKDRNPLMFSFANDNCPKQCLLRIGQNYARDQGYEPCWGPKFPLTVGLHSMILRLNHRTLPPQIYNIGVEVRQGTGRYKHTQVVMLTPRYVLSNQTSSGLSLSHIDYINRDWEAHLGLRFIRRKVC